MTDERLLVRDGLPQIVVDAAAELLPLLRNVETGGFALGLSGSMSKNTADGLSDVDFRFYSEQPRPDSDASWDRAWAALHERWHQRGVTLDELWFRTFDEVDATIDDWLAGRVVPDDMIWTVWGYHPLTDLSRQIAVVDPDGVIERWRSRLARYPAALGEAIVRRHWAPLSYWRGDYHYRNKAVRGDLVFLAGLSAKLVHHLLQVTFALNQVHFPGDGNNLVLAERFETAPADFAARITAVLYPPAGAGDPVGQRESLVALIDEVAALVERAFPAQEWTR